MLAVVLLAAFGNAQDSRVLMTIAGDDVNVDEFLAIYNKNNTNNVVDKKSMEEYMDLFINFKLKVAEAESLGMDTAKKFIGELAGYRRQLANPYLVDRETTDNLVKEAYDRMNQDVEAYHILIMLDAAASPADTLMAWKKIKAIRQSIKNLDDFKRLAKEESGDPSAKENAGYLGYFTAFKMVYPFENAAYNTKVGEMSKPVRTRFGYHIIYVSDKRPARGEIRAAHIMVKSTDKMSSEDQMSAKAKIDEISQQLKGGADFAVLAKQYSQDEGTAGKGGLLPWFGTGRMVESFEDAAFALKNDGDISDPVQTAYGWHIIRREEYKGIETFDALESTIKRRIERDTRGEKGKESLIAKLKKEYSLSMDYKNRDKVNKLVNNDYMVGTWNIELGKLSSMTAPVLTIADPMRAKMSMVFTQADYAKFLQKNQKKGKGEMVLSQILGDQWESFVDDAIIKFEDNNLENKYPEFKALMQEYHDGILLFDLMDQRVWSKAVKDSAGLEGFYQENKNDFMWAERVDASMYLAANEAIAKKAQKLAKKRGKTGVTDGDIMKTLNVDNPLNLSIRSGVFAREEDEILDSFPWEVGVSDFMARGDKVAFVEIRKTLDPQPKELSEARGVITSAYQNYLEEQWIKELRERYDFKVNQAVFNDIKG